MNDPRPLLQRQAQWQRTRASLSWPEKVRMSEAIRQSIEQLRRVGNKTKQTDATSEFPAERREARGPYGAP